MSNKQTVLQILIHQDRWMSDVEIARCYGIDRRQVRSILAELYQNRRISAFRSYLGVLRYAYLKEFDGVAFRGRGF